MFRVGVALSFLTALAALLVAIRGLRQAKRSADAAVRAVELAEKQASQRPVEWKLEHIDEDSSWLTNASSYAAVDVTVEYADGPTDPQAVETVSRIDAHQREIIQLGPEEPIKVTWVWEGTSQRHTWTGWVP